VVLKVGDVIEVAETSKEHQNIVQCQSRPRLDLPSFLEKTEPMKGKIVADPTTADIPFNYNERLIAEYYATRGRK
jgi:ribosomal protein S4